MNAPAIKSSADSAPITSNSANPPSENRLAANRANAQKSTGPKTSAGRSNSSKNSLRHGAYAQSTLLPDDNPIHFQQLRTDFLQTLSPQTPFELYLAERAVSIAWRLHRFTQASADLHFYRQNPLLSPFDYSHLNLTKAEDRLQSMLHRTLKQLQSLQKQRQETPPPPCSYLTQSETENAQNEPNPVGRHLSHHPDSNAQNEPTEIVGCDSSHHPQTPHNNKEPYFPQL